MPLAVTIYEMSVAIHVIVAIITLGVTFLFGPLQMAAEKSPRNMPFVMRVIHNAERNMVWPGLAIIFVTGVYQTFEGGYESAVWLSASVTIFAFAVIVSLTVMRKAMDVALAEAERAERLAGDDGEIVLSSEFKQAAAILARTGPLLGLAVIVIAFLMETKPA